MRIQSSRAWAIACGVSLLTLTALVTPNLGAEAASRVYKAGTSYSYNNPQNADAYLQTGAYQAAEARYTKLLQANPKNIAARAALSNAQAELFKLGAAEKNANMVLAKSPNNATARTALGIVYRNQTASLDMTYRGQRDELLAKSASELQKAVAANPRSPEAHNQLGVTYRFMGRNAEAQSEFQKALELDPRFAEAILNEGIMRLSSGDVNGAKQQFQRAIKLNSKNYMAHYRLGEAYLQSGDTHQALKSLNTALSLNQGNASVMSKMADAYQAQGNTSAAIANYRKAIQANPAFMPAYVAISDIFDSRGDGELAMSELRSAINVNPNFSAGRNRLGRLALTVDKPDQALQYYKESLKQNPQDADAINGISQALTVIAQKQANWSQTMGADSDLLNAEQSIQEALRMNPGDLRLHLANLRISQLAGKPAMTEAELNTLVSRSPRNDAEAMAQGEAYLSLGRYQEADQVFNGLMQRASGNSDQLLIIGDTLKVNGDLPRAKDAYRAALAAEPGNLKAQRGIDRIEKAEAESQKALRTAKALNTWRRTGKESSIDFYEDTLSQNPRQPEARLELAKLYEKTKEYNLAARSYQFYLGLSPDLPVKEREGYLKKIAKLQEKAQEMALKQSGSPQPQGGASMPYSAPATNTQAAPLQLNTPAKTAQY
ncbi:tetratricopeptide repeat protein [Vampirovibrio chlorellavorus]|uniref:tetratricopeptide repeat protein n=1 Tax=Vampirovibrio chlorellavorus TaxID=758823 RepID=UPI0026ECBC11|nr:tetratricopeptide repeat protein [Vampirovibrio chlorellavorus]